MWRGSPAPPALRLTACVDYVVTDLALLRRDRDPFVLNEVAPGFTPHEAGQTHTVASRRQPVRLPGAGERTGPECKNVISL